MVNREISVVQSAESQYTHSSYQFVLPRAVFDHTGKSFVVIVFKLDLIVVVVVYSGMTWKTDMLKLIWAKLKARNSVVDFEATKLATTKVKPATCFPCIYIALVVDFLVVVHLIQHSDSGYILHFLHFIFLYAFLLDFNGKMCGKQKMWIDQLSLVI